MALINNIVRILKAGLPFIVAGAVFVSGGTFLGVSVTTLFGLTVPQTAVALSLFVTLAWIVATSEDEVSFPFLLSLSAILLFLYAFVAPGPVKDAFRPLVETVNLDAIDVIEYMALTFAAILIYWVVKFRAGSGTNTPTGIANKIFGTGETRGKGELTKLVEEYVTIGRMILLFVLGAIIFTLQQGAPIADEIAGVLGQDPVTASNIINLVVGFFALGGGVPDFLAWIPGVEALAAAFRTLPPVGYLALGVVVLLIAIGARQQVRESREKLQRARESKREAESTVDRLKSFADNLRRS